MQTEVDKALSVLNEAQTLLYPTDTVWGLGCDAKNPEAVSKIYTIKQREESKALICLVSSMEMLQNYVGQLSEDLKTLIETAERPTTIIYTTPTGFAQNLLAEDGSIAIRLVRDGFAHELIETLGSPIVSTSANISGEPTPKTFKEIDTRVLKSVDYVVNLPKENSTSVPSRIIKYNSDGSVTILRD
ncbi:L-threonylcarbamoyladenylate synthase [Winogradskyella maritima]|uniref:L-threonylcarbamoyladenylate synthase n=1 Tax=Winogradskyella maritima TaxID=1517766 RepID=A0ABV8AKT1_9FLAO|nr:L-threonylcarbamoyladenylate synthase [Winogradskyella maritima]